MTNAASLAGYACSHTQVEHFSIPETGALFGSR